MVLSLVGKLMVLHSAKGQTVQSQWTPQHFVVIDGHPDRRQHPDRLSVVLTAADQVEVDDAIPVLPSK